jgi:hypothetical protein
MLRKKYCFQYNTDDKNFEIVSHIIDVQKVVVLLLIVVVVIVAVAVAAAVVRPKEVNQHLARDV